jgi:diguanylate cyclase (GGDEF)-like protein
LHFAAGAALTLAGIAVVETLILLRLRACVRVTDTVARLGGDEFVILLEDVKDPADAQRVADKIVQESRRPLRLEEREVTVTASIGVASNIGAATEDELVKRADAALYAAKAAGRNGYRVAEA